MRQALSENIVDAERVRQLVSREVTLLLFPQHKKVNIRPR